MRDKYGVKDDPDCYPGSHTLINFLHITDADLLEAAEREITAFAASHIEFSPPPYSLDYLCSIHKTLFEDIYAWAGSIRAIDISKGGTRFCLAHRIVAEAKKVFSSLAQEDNFERCNRAELVKKVADFYGDINMLHPFREGNGRAQRILFEHIVVNAGFEIAWASITAEEWLEANIASVHCDYRLLEALFERCIGKAIDE